MPLVKVGSKNQVVIPKAVRAKLQIKPGDYVDVSFQNDQAVLTRKKVVDYPVTDEPVGPKTKAAIEKATKEVKTGKGQGPFKSAEDLIDDLHRRSSK
jgi:AbrB family looped-hinge helix DNA binding protein